MAKDYSFNLRGYTDEELYDHLRGVWNRARKRFNREADSAYDFQTADKHVNLLSVRGFSLDSMEPVKNTASRWDDTLFVLYTEGAAKKVEKYKISTEHQTGTGMSLMIFGMHRYQLGFHKPTMEVHEVNAAGADVMETKTRSDGTTYQVPKTKVVTRPRIDKDAYSQDDFPGAELLSNSSVPLTGTTLKAEYRTYRALNPDLGPTDVSQVVDANGDLSADGENESAGWGLNVHFGGENAEGPQNWSLGCQVLFHWRNYCALVSRLESDDSIEGTQDNQKEAASNKQPKRPVIYTLVEGSFLKPPSIQHAFASADAESLFASNESGGTGLFPIGSNRFWHGGVHLKHPPASAVRAIADGEIMAYRLESDSRTTMLEGKSVPYSACFALMKHKFTTPKGNAIEFWSHYMHLLPKNTYAAGNLPPSFAAQREFHVAANASDGKGLNIRDPNNCNLVLAVVPKGMELTVDMTKGPPASWKGAAGYKAATWGGVNGVIYPGNATRPKVKQVSGSTYKCMTAEDTPASSAELGVAVYETQDADGKVTRIAKRGSALVFKLPETAAVDVRMVEGWYELASGGWVKVEGGNVACKTATTVSCVLDQTVILNPPLPVSAGAILGYPGPYLDGDALIHLEILASDVGFLKNPKSDAGGQKTLKIDKGAVFKTRAPVTVTDATVNLGPRCELRITEDCGAFVRVVCTTLVGWVPFDALAYDATKKKYKVTRDLTSVAHSNPDAGVGAVECAVAIPTGTWVAGDKAKEDSDRNHRRVRFDVPASETARLTGWAWVTSLGTRTGSTCVLSAALTTLADKNPGAFQFTTDAGKNAGLIFADVPDTPGDPTLCHDEQGKLWQEIEYEAGKKGWIAHDATPMLTAFDWPKWLDIKEDGSLSADGFCDAAALMERIDKDHDGKITVAELTNEKEFLRTLACYAPTEWSEPKDKYKRALTGQPLKLSQAEYDEVINVITALHWWEQMAQEIRDKISGAPGGMVWHLHPIGFVQQMQRLARAGLVVA